MSVNHQCGIRLEQWFSNFSMDQNLLLALLNTSCRAPPRDFDSECLTGASKFAFLNKLPGSTCDAEHSPHFEKHTADGSNETD